jgi:hypothetical protein
VQWSSAIDRAAVLVAVEALALLVLGIGYGIEGVSGQAQSLAGVEVGALLIAGSGVLLLLVARGLLRRRRWSRSPAVVVQRLLALTALSLLQTLPLVSVVVLAVTATALYLLLTAEARAALGGPPAE